MSRSTGQGSSNAITKHASQAEAEAPYKSKAGMGSQNKLNRMLVNQLTRKASFARSAVVVSSLERCYSIPVCFKNRKGVVAATIPETPRPLAKSNQPNNLNQSNHVKSEDGQPTIDALHPMELPSTIRSIIPGSRSIPIDTLSIDQVKQAMIALQQSNDKLSEQLAAHQSAKELMDPHSVGLQLTVNAIIMTSGLLQTARRCQTAMQVLLEYVQEIDADSRPNSENSNKQPTAMQLQEALNILNPFYNSDTGFLFDFEPPYHFL